MSSRESLFFRFCLNHGRGQSKWRQVLHEYEDQAPLPWPIKSSSSQVSPYDIARGRKRWVCLASLGDGMILNRAPHIPHLPLGLD